MPISSTRVLVVDDHEDTRNATALILRRSGYPVDTAATKAEAIQLCDCTEFDILLADISLPDGSGNDLMRELASRCKIKGIAISGYGGDDDVTQSLAAGFSAHLLKPTTLDTLLRTIREVAAAPFQP